MKISYVVSASPTKFSAISYNPDLEGNLKEIAGLGFDGVELGVRDPKEMDVDLLKSLAGKHGLEICAIGTGQAFGEEGLSFSDPDENIRKQAIQRIKEQIEFTSQLGALLIIGLIRGRTTAGVSKTQALEWVKECLLECLALAEKKDVRMVIEPINRYETDLLNTVPETVDFIKQVNSPRLFTLVDTFHMNIEEVDMLDSIRQAADLIVHVHTADSNRWAPGCGHVDFNAVAETLKNINYQGYLSAEILPLPDTHIAMSKSAETLRPILASL